MAPWSNSVDKARSGQVYIWRGVERLPGSESETEMEDFLAAMELLDLQLVEWGNDLANEEWFAVFSNPEGREEEIRYPTETFIYIEPRILSAQLADRLLELYAEPVEAARG
jgi:hypothetical protein